MRMVYIGQSESTKTIHAIDVAKGITTSFCGHFVVPHTDTRPCDPAGPLCRSCLRLVELRNMASEWERILAGVRCGIPPLLEQTR